MKYANEISRPWGIYWSIWASVMFLSFIGPEIYALCTNWKNTLSNSIWSLERFTPHQQVGQWTVIHFMLCGIYLIMTVWLFGHFWLGWWRS